MVEANEHIQKLAAADTLAVQARREVVEALAQPYRRGHTEDIRDMLVKLQSKIEALDRAAGQRGDASSIEARTCTFDSCALDKHGCIDGVGVTQSFLTGKANQL